MKNMVTIIPFLFFFSGIYAVFSNVALFFILKRKGIRTNFALSAVPGYLQSLYFNAEPSIRSRTLDMFVFSVTASAIVAVSTGVVLIILIKIAAS